MGQGYWRNVDDGYSDPEMLSAAYQIGRSAYFEVELTLAEYNDRIQANSGGLAGSPNLIAATASNGSGTGIGCPEENQWVWVESKGEVNHLKAKSLLDLAGEIKLYNPLTGKFNLMASATLLKNVDLYSAISRTGVESISSLSHKLIRNTSDITGLALSNFVVGTEVLRVQNSDKNIFLDTLAQISFVGVGNVVEIKLKKEFIYASGTRRAEALVAHNRKEPPDGVLT